MPSSTKWEFPTIAERDAVWDGMMRKVIGPRYYTNGGVPMSAVAFKPGNVVILKSGGPMMTVVCVTVTGDKPVHCAWFEQSNYTDMAESVETKYGDLNEADFAADSVMLVDGHPANKGA